MEIFWAVILVLMLTIFVILDGFDFGVGSIHLLFSKDEKEREKMLQAIGPFWDGNEVWLLAAGGVLFFAFPTLYASSFSGFYLPLIIVLWLLMFRGIGMELRGLIDNEMWRSIWDKAFGISSILLALFFGAALGNVVRGVNLGGVQADGSSIYEAHTFFAPLWTSKFSPASVDVGVLDWFTVLMGLISVVVLITHGATWLRFKLSGEINLKMRRLIPFSLSLQVILSMVSVFVLFIFKENPFNNYFENPLLFVFPIFAVTSVFMIYIYNFKNKEFKLFASSSIFIFSSFMTTAMGMWPVLLPSTNKINPSLTIASMATEKYGLNVGLFWWIIGIILVIIYFTVVHRVFKGKLDENTYDH
jgi:cytochrome d ubiquinol oxidase subunit II